MAQKAKLQLSWDYHELKTGHDATIIIPNQLVQIPSTSSLPSLSTILQDLCPELGPVYKYHSHILGSDSLYFPSFPASA